MEEVADIIALIARTSSTIDKQKLLLKHKENKELLKVLQFIYDPYFKTNISDAKLDKGQIISGYPVPKSLEDMIRYLKSHPTGSREDCSIATTWLNNHKTPEERWLCRCIITQNMQIGVSIKTLNKVFGNSFIEKISCMLGTPLKSVTERQQAWPYIVTEKLDGTRRMLLIDQQGHVRLFSRNGHIDTGLVDIETEAKFLPKGYMYDGELLAKGYYKDSLSVRQATSSIANTKGVRTGLDFHIFDMVPLDEFFQGCSLLGTVPRKSLLAATLGDEASLQLLHPNDFTQILIAHAIPHTFEHIKAVPVLAIANLMEDVEPIVQYIWSIGGEGVMLNAADAKYMCKRTKTLIKMKKTQTYILPILDFTEGANKYEDMLGAIVTKWKGNYLQVGSGFTDYERQVIWANQADYIGLNMEVESFGESTAMNGLSSLNCPIFKRIVRND